jgi:hypothetical protein
MNIILLHVDCDLISAYIFKTKAQLLLKKQKFFAYFLASVGVFRTYKWDLSSYCLTADAVPTVYICIE